MSKVSTRERIAHVVRRLGYGANAAAIEDLATPEDAIAWALDTSRPAAEPPVIDAPADRMRRDRDATRIVFRYWLERLLTAVRPIEERLVWFWHDHFAIDLRKVQEPYLLHQHHQMLRTHATANFGELLQAVAVDPAMLRYLDGATSSAANLNENFGREVLELYTVGHGNFTEDDVIASARSFTGWVVYVPGGRADRLLRDAEPWTSVFVPFRHDGGTKTLLGITGRHDAAAAIAIMLDHPATADRIAAKLYAALIGLPPSPEATIRLGNLFRRDYSIMPLVEAIVAEPAFLSDAAVNSKIRSPLEQAVGVAQVVASDPAAIRTIVPAIEAIGYFPFRAPNPAGYPKGPRLLSPHRLVSTFDFATVLPQHLTSATAAEMLATLGVFDISPTTADVLGGTPDPHERWALAVNSPEHHRV